MKKILINLALLSSIGLVGCSTNTQGQNTGIGAVTGAAIGGVGVGVLGGNPVAIGAGIVGGAIIGGVVGHSMDSTDNTTTYTVINNNPTHKTTKWTNHKTGVVYTITPTSNLFTFNGNPNCREFYFTSTRHGRMHDYNGTACMMKDGKWYTVQR